MPHTPPKIETSQTWRLPALIERASIGAIQATLVALRGDVVRAGGSALDLVRFWGVSTSCKAVIRRQPAT